ncbi:MAG TPA: universal stress protein [Bacteroidales bacterium]|nr:universal stress protein [Bacteroidales bacterium]
MESINNKSIVVPHDFSSASVKAIEFSAYLAEKMKKKLILLNICDSGTLNYLKIKGLNKSNIEEELQKIASDLSKQYNVEIECLVKPARILDIGMISYKHNASYITIGLEKPKKGASKIMRMIVKSPIPVFIVHDRPFHPINDIVFPLDETEESRQKSGWAAKIALATNATVHVYSINLEHQPDSIRFSHNLVVKQIEKFFSEQWVKFKTIYASDTKTTFGKQYVSYAESINAGLIIIIRESTSLSFLSSIIWKPNDKAVLFNSKRIPSLIINPKIYSAR